jgi:hypothetical protein
MDAGYKELESDPVQGMTCETDTRFIGSSFVASSTYDWSFISIVAKAGAAVTRVGAERRWEDRAGARRGGREKMERAYAADRIDPIRKTAT